MDLIERRKLLMQSVASEPEAGPNDGLFAVGKCWDSSSSICSTDYGTSFKNTVTASFVQVSASHWNYSYPYSILNAPDMAVLGTTNVYTASSKTVRDYVVVHTPKNASSGSYDQSLSGMVSASSIGFYLFTSTGSTGASMSANCRRVTITKTYYHSWQDPNRTGPIWGSASLVGGMVSSLIVSPTLTKLALAWDKRFFVVNFSSSVYRDPIAWVKSGSSTQPMSARARQITVDYTSSREGIVSTSLYEFPQYTSNNRSYNPVVIKTVSSLDNDLTYIIALHHVRGNTIDVSQCSMSRDGGQTWVAFSPTSVTQSLPVSDDYLDAVISQDGSTAMILSFSGSYISRDYLTSWEYTPWSEVVGISQSNLPRSMDASMKLKHIYVLFGNSVSSSTDSQSAIVVASHDYGKTFATTSFNKKWRGRSYTEVFYTGSGNIKCSGNGKNVILTVSKSVSGSSDYGRTWTNQTITGVSQSRIFFKEPTEDFMASQRAALNI